MYHHDCFRNEVISATLAALSELGLATIAPRDVAGLLSTPPDFTLGQAAFPCFPFAKQLRLAPAKIAEQLAAIVSAANFPTIARVDAVNGYLNFHCQFEEAGLRLVDAIFGESVRPTSLIPLAETDKVVVEYSQPNTHKALHVGHLRCLVLGDATANILEYVGHKVVRVTYPGDLGTHVAKTLWYIQTRCKEPLPETDRANWLGRIYAEADDAYKAAQGTADETLVKEEIATVLRDVREHRGQYYDLWKTSREWSLDEMRSVYDWLNVHFETWYSESECMGPARDLVLQKYAEGFFVKDQGAIGIDLSQHKLGFALFLKSDGNPIYLTQDLVLLQKKFADPAVTRSIAVVDARQKLHFQQLFKTAEILGYEQAKRSVHLSYETVNTPDGGAFSSRARNGLELRELRGLMERKVTSDYLERYRNKWSDAEIQQTAENVTIGALKYGMLRVDNMTQIHFVLEEWLRLDGDTGPYLQYVHARCRNILEKQGQPVASKIFLVRERAETELLFALSRLNDVAMQAAQQLRPSLVANYLNELARFFNRFYEQCSIREESGEIRNTRLHLVALTAAVMKRGLTLLGIPAPERM